MRELQHSRRAMATAALTVAACALATAPTATFGQSRTWDGGTDANADWSTGNNWSTNTAPPLSEPNAGWRFGTTATELVTNMDNNYSFGQLQLNGSSGYVINSSNGSTMSLSGSNNGRFIDITPAGATNLATVNVPITLNSLNTTNVAGEGNRRTINTDAGTVILNGTLTANADPSRNFDVRKIGTGSLTLGTANVMTGTFESTNGTVRLGSDLALGAASVIVNNGAANTVRFVPNDATARTLANPWNLAGAGPLVLTEANGANMTLTGDITTSVVKGIGVLEGTTATLSGRVSGTGGIGKNNPGTLILSGINSYVGQTVINNGVLVVNGNNSTSDTLVGAGTLNGSGSVRVLSVYDEPTNPFIPGTLSPGSDTAADEFTGSRADFASGGRYLFNLNNVATGAGIGWDLLTLNGAGTPNANLDITAGTGEFTILLTGPGTGFDETLAQSFQIVDAASLTGFDAADFLIDTSGFAKSFSGTFGVSDANGDLNLVYTPVPEPAGTALLLLGAAAMASRRGRR